MAIIDTLLRQTVTIKPFLREGAGEPLYGEPEQRKCRFQTGISLKRGYYVSGERQMEPAGALMFCCGEEIPIRSIAICEGKEYTVTGCSVMQGFGTGHLEVTLV